MAPDGGLYYPKHIPTFTVGEQAQLRAVWKEWQGAEDATAAQRYLQLIGFELLNKWFGNEIPAEALRDIAIGAQSFPMPTTSRLNREAASW